jgi:hypothetical protein
MVKLGARYPNYKGILNLGDSGVYNDAVEVLDSVEDQLAKAIAEDMIIDEAQKSHGLLISASFSVKIPTWKLSP